MSFTVDQAFVKQFKDNVFHLSQQRDSRLRNAVFVDNAVVGENAFFERIGTTEMTEKTTRHSDTVLTEVPHSRRMVEFKDFTLSELIDREDKLRLLIDPASEYTKAFTSAVGRRIDRTIIAALEGTAKAGKAGATSVVLPTGQKIAASAADMTVPKLRQAKQKMDGAEVSSDGRFLALSSAQIEALLATTEATSQDFNTVRALVSGELNTFLGFTFLMTELLTKTGNDRQCLAFQRDGTGFSMPGEVEFNMQRNPAKNYAWQPHISITLGAVRIEEVTVVQIDCDESA